MAIVAVLAVLIALGAWFYPDIREVLTTRLAAGSGKRQLLRPPAAERTPLESLTSLSEPPNIRHLIPVAGVVRIENMYVEDLNNDGHWEIVVCSRRDMDDDLMSSIRVDFLTHNRRRKTWKNELHLEMDSPSFCKFRVQEANLRAKGGQEILVSHTGPNANYLSYWLVGYKGKKLSILLHEEDVPKGQVYVRGSRLIVRSFDQTWAYRWNGKSFGRVDVGLVPMPRSLLVSYWWKHGKACADASSITLQVGESVYLVRDEQCDEYGGPAKMLVGSHDGRTSLSFLPATTGLVAAEPGETYVILIPQTGGHWETLRLSVSVTEQLTPRASVSG